MAVPQLFGVDGVEVSEPLPVVEIPNTQFIISEPEMIATASTADSPFSDPHVSYQWHYNNDGSLPNSRAGADINLFDAWAVETGSPEVIVAVFDMGVESTHEDLAHNMWDDGNGHFGYNFVDDNYNISYGTHGTHVAGTIAAVNNNGIGVGGIAGGNGSPTSGVRIMSCMMGDEDAPHSTAAIKAFPWAADNGAVIAQCSWKVGDSQALQTAINYFVTNAGNNVYGKQTGPMSGGLVVVSAGNDYAYIGQYPAAYDNVISVASIGPDYLKPPYSNCHITVDISAPGGNPDDKFIIDKHHGYILSTYTDNKYAWSYGTSMAAPHVSGVAALVVSKFGGPGFTAAQLKQRLLDACNLQLLYTYNSSYIGQMGKGLIDAAKAVGTISDVYISGPEETFINKTETYLLRSLPSEGIRSITWSLSKRFVSLNTGIDFGTTVSVNPGVGGPIRDVITVGAEIIQGQGTPSLNIRFNKREYITLKATVVDTKTRLIHTLML